KMAKGYVHAVAAKQLQSVAPTKFIIGHISLANTATLGGKTKGSGIESGRVIFLTMLKRWSFARMKTERDILPMYSLTKRLSNSIAIPLKKMRRVLERSSMAI